MRIISFLSTIADVKQILKETVLFSFVMHSNDAETIDLILKLESCDNLFELFFSHAQFNDIVPTKIQFSDPLGSNR